MKSWHCVGRKPAPPPPLRLNQSKKYEACLLPFFDHPSSYPKSSPPTSLGVLNHAALPGPKFFLLGIAILGTTTRSSVAIISCDFSCGILNLDWRPRGRVTDRLSPSSLHSGSKAHLGVRVVFRQQDLAPPSQHLSGSLSPVSAIICVYRRTLCGKPDRLELLQLLFGLTVHSPSLLLSQEKHYQDVDAAAWYQRPAGPAPSAASVSR
jgi:hypothetical protein